MEAVTFKTTLTLIVNIHLNILKVDKILGMIKIMQVLIRNLASPFIRIFQATV